MNRYLKAITFAVPATVAAVIGAAAVSSPAQAQVTLPAVFVYPHADDLMLSMGPAVVQHIRSRGAANVYVVAYTDSGSSGSAAHLSAYSGEDTTHCSYKATNGVCVYGPQFDPQNPSASRAALTAARDAEDRAAIQALGVLPQNIIMYGDTCRPASQPMEYQSPAIAAAARPFVAKTQCIQPDARLQSTANGLWDWAIAKWGRNASFKTQSDKDPSLEHRVLGVGLRNALNAGRVIDARFYYPGYQLHMNTLTNNQKLVVEGTPSDYSVLVNAAKQYGVINTAANRYGIGFDSVAYAFGGTGAGMGCGVMARGGPTSVLQKSCRYVPGRDNNPQWTLCTGNATLCSPREWFTGRSTPAYGSTVAYGNVGPGVISSLRHN